MLSARKSAPPAGRARTPGARSAVGGRTLASDVTRRLRADIVSCVLKPEARLRFEKLREIYGASFTTLREALFCLQAEGLVVAEGQRGFWVAPVSAENLRDLIHTRILIERETIRLAIENGDSAWEAQILAAFHRIDRLETRYGEESALRRDWVEAHEAFHAALTSACGSPTLLAMRANLFELGHRYRSLSGALRGVPRHNTVDHRALMEAVLALQVPRALDLIEAHIRQTQQHLMTALFLVGDP